MRHPVRNIGAGLVVAGAILLVSGCHPAPLVAVGDATGREDPNPAFSKVRFQVRLVPGGPGQQPTAHNDVAISCTTTGGTATAGTDYHSLTGGRCGTIPAGSQSVYVDVAVVDDRIIEMRETFTLRITAVGAEISDGTATGSIAADFGSG